MEIDFLRHFGFHPQLISILQNAYGKEFLPLQERVIREHGLFANRNLVICAPTSSGKTFLAEALFLYHALHTRKVILLVPTKALANQRYEELKSRYAPLGYDIVLSSRDHTEDDGQIYEGRFHLAIIIYEKFRALRASQSAWLYSVGACVVDELHYVYNPTRGPDLELLLTELRTQPELQILGLSSVVSDELAAKWLNAELVVENERPVELRQGVLCGDTFTYLEFNTQRKNTETFPLCGHTDHGLAMIEAAQHFAERNEPTLCFWPRKDQCCHAAGKLAAQYDADDSIDLQPVKNLEPSMMREALLELIPRRLAVHTSDLTTQERRVVEHYCRTGDILIICATSTLAEGLNLPVVNVLTTPLMYANPNLDCQDSTPIPMLIKQDQLHNMTGRAGRKGLKAFGRGILITHSPADIEGLLHLYETKPLAPMLPKVGSTPLEELALQTIGLRKGTNFERCVQFLGNTLTGYHQLWPAELSEQFYTAVETGKTHQLLSEECGRLYTTPIGDLVCNHGLSEHSARRLADYIQQHVQKDMHPLQHLLFITMLDEMAQSYLPVPRSQVMNHAWTRKLESHLDEHHVARSEYIARLLENKAALRVEHHRAFKKTILLYSWKQGTDTHTLEKQFGIYIGAIIRMAEEASWLLSCLAGTASSYGFDAELTKPLHLLRESVHYGLPAANREWLNMIKNQTLTRREVLLLVQAGYASPKEIQAQDEEHIHSLAPNKFHLIFVDQPAQNDPPKKPVKYEIHFDPSRPDSVSINQQTIQFTKIQGNLLRYLAQAPEQCVEYESILNTVWPDSIGDKKLLSRQKNLILKKIQKTIGKTSSPLIETVPGHGLVLRARIQRMANG